MPSHPTYRQRAPGFSLIEVLIAMLVMVVGLLGIAKIQALAFSNTNIARVRSLAALEASSLSAAMRSNQTYWSTGLAPASFTITGTTLSDATLNGQSVDCAASSCTNVQMAAYDLKQWGAEIATQLVAGTGQIDCTTVTTTPITCTISIFWLEKNALPTQGAGPIPASSRQRYQLVVQP